jgi:hypothetical protein
MLLPFPLIAGIVTINLPLKFQKVITDKGISKNCSFNHLIPSFLFNEKYKGSFKICPQASTDHAMVFFNATLISLSSYELRLKEDSKIVRELTLRMRKTIRANPFPDCPV